MEENYYIVWKDCGKTVERLWKDCGKTVERLWKDCGKTVERLWKAQASTTIPQFLQSVEYVDFFQVNYIFLNMQVTNFQKPLDNLMGKEITHQCSNSRKIILWREIPSSELSFIALYQKTITQNSESASFMELL